jgi:acetolactate synthase-1/2/3 large subunit
MTSITGAQAIVKALEHEGTDVAFGVPGGAILSAYDTLLDSSVRHVLARHEQGAGHMAEGYAHATGRVGVTVATSGPGATNLITPLQDALMDSIPIVAVTGQVASTAMGNDAFQEADTSGLAMHCTKHSYLITDPDDIGDVVHEAFYLASSGRPGPVLIHVPKDVLAASTTWHEPGPVDLPGYRPAGAGHPRQIRRAVEMLAKAERPVIYVGGGVIKANAHADLLRLVEASGAPVVTTLMARGAFPDDHPLALGMSGMHGTFAATTAMQKADLLFTLGARFDDRVTGDPDSFAPHAKIVHVDVDPAEIGKVRHADVPIVGDVGTVLGQIIVELHRTPQAEPPAARKEWLETVQGWQRDRPLAYQQDPGAPLKPQYVIEELYAAAGSDTVVVSGVGQHQMWASQFWRFSKPRSWINSGGLGTMGFAIPAAIGAKVGRPDDLVYAIDGDGCFQMTAQELVTASTHGIPIKVAILNNGGLGLVRQWQNLFYDGRYHATDLTDHTPDYVKLAEAMGCVGLRAETPGEVGPVIEKSLHIDDRPVVVEFRVDPDEMCFPMVVAGGSNDRIAMGPEDLA